MGRIICLGLQLQLQTHHWKTKEDVDRDPGGPRSDWYGPRFSKVGRDLTNLTESRPSQISAHPDLGPPGSRPTWLNLGPVRSRPTLLNLGPVGSRPTRISAHLTESRPSQISAQSDLGPPDWISAQSDLGPPASRPTWLNLGPPQSRPTIRRSLKIAVQMAL
jgi:hypothetical protein